MGNYNRFAKKYTNESEKWEKETRNKFYSYLPSLENKILLDVGCGSGIDADYYSGVGAKVFGVDISEKQIKIARKRKIGEFIIGNMEKLPFRSESFDIITSFYALQTTEKVTESISEMIRVAKIGARIVILTKHPFRNMIEGYVNDGKTNYYSKKIVRSKIFNKTITLSEPTHTMMEYLDPKSLEVASLEQFKEGTDFPASEQVISELIYPTYMILIYKKIGKIEQKSQKLAIL